MSVYTDLVRIGLADESATAIAEAVQRSTGLVTVEVLDARLAQLETRLVRTIHTSMIAMTGIFAAFVAAMAWVVSR